MRLRKIIKKEFKEFIRDRTFVMTLVLLPLILMLVFGYTFQGDIVNLNTIVIDDDSSEYSRNVIDAVVESEYFYMVSFNGTLEEAKEQLQTSDARAIFHIPQGFGETLDGASKAELTLYLDSSDYTIYNILKGSSGDVIKTSLKNIVQLIVEDLEDERNTKQKNVDEIETLLDSIDEKAKNTFDDIHNLNSQFDDTRARLTDTEEKIKRAESEIVLLTSEANSLESQINETVDALDDLVTALETLKLQCPDCTVAINSILLELDDMKNQVEESKRDIQRMNPSGRLEISSEHFNVDYMKTKLDENEKTSNRVNVTALEIKDTYRNIQDKMDGVHLELRTLKKEFLSEPLELKKELVFGEVTYFQYLTPAVMTLILFFIGFMLTLINIVDERTSKTLFRLATTPITNIEFFGGKFIIFFLAGIIEAFYVLLLGIVLFDVIIVGSFASALLVLLLLISASIGLGLLVSSIVKSMRQAMMMGPLVVIPSILISQTFSPIEIMPEFMRYFAYLSPMFYSNTALRSILIKGTALVDVWQPVLILALYAILTLLIGILILKKRIE